MGRKSAGGLLGSLIAVGVTLGVVKYLKDYAGVKFTDDEQIDKTKNDTGAVKEAAKRTYIAIKEKSNVKEAAAELSKAAGSVVSDAADIAVTAGTETVNAFKDIKLRYDEDPEGVRTEIGENIGEMASELVKNAQDKTGELIDKIKNAYSDDEDEYANMPEDDGDTEADDEDLSDAETAAASDASETEESAEESETECADPETAEQQAAAESAADDESEDGFKLHYVEEDDSESNVTITDDAE